MWFEMGSVLSKKYTLDFEDLRKKGQNISIIFYWVYVENNIWLHWVK